MIALKPGIGHLRHARYWPGAWYWRGVATLFGLCLGLASGLPSAHADSKRVLVQGVSGTQGGSLRSALVSNLNKNSSIVLVSDGELKRALKTLKIRGRSLSTKNMKRVSAFLRVHAFVSGGVSRQRRGWSLRLRVKNGKNGKTLGTAAWSGRTLGSLRSVRNSASAKLAPYLEKAEVADSSVLSKQSSKSKEPDKSKATTPPLAEPVPIITAQPKTPPAQPSPLPPPALPPASQPTPNSGWQNYGAGTQTGVPPTYGNYPPAGGMAPGQGYGGAGYPQQGYPPVGSNYGSGSPQGYPAAPGTWPGATTPGAYGQSPGMGGTEANWWQDSNEPAFKYPVGRLMLGFGTIGRSMSARLNYGADQLPQNRNYNSNPPGHFELHLGGDFYPGAFGNQPFPYLGIAPRGRFGLNANTVGCGFVSVPGVECPETDQISVGTSQYEILVPLRGRYRFGDDGKGPELYLDAGWGMFAFTFNLDELLLLWAENPAAVVPSVTYSYIHLGAGGSYQILDPYLTIAAEAYFRVGLGIGNDARLMWGLNTPPPLGFGFAIIGRTDFSYLIQGMFGQLRIEYFQFMTGFKGQAGCAQGADCDADAPWPLFPEGGGVENVVSDHYLRLMLGLGYEF